MERLTIKELKRKIEELGAEMPPKNARKATYVDYLERADRYNNELDVDYNTENESESGNDRVTSALVAMTEGISKIQETVAALVDKVTDQASSSYSPSTPLPAEHVSPAPLPQVHNPLGSVPITPTCPPPGGFNLANASAELVSPNEIPSVERVSPQLRANIVADEYFEKSVAVQLDEKESTLNFFVLPSNEEFSKYSGVDAYVIVYSVADKSSFKQTKEHTKFIRKHISREMPIIIVGNKSDIVRQRQITPEDGKNAATQLDCKFIETSATLNHQVDDLLVGILSQIRLFKKGGDSHHKHAKAMNPKGALTKFLQKHNVVTKSCDNLLVK